MTTTLFQLIQDWRNGIYNAKEIEALTKLPTNTPNGLTLTWNEIINTLHNIEHVETTDQTSDVAEFAWPTRSPDHADLVEAAILNLTNTLDLEIAALQRFQDKPIFHAATV